jgi:hypothetical protein
MKQYDNRLQFYLTSHWYNFIIIHFMDFYKVEITDNLFIILF